MNPEQSMPSPEKGPHESAGKLPGTDMHLFGALCGGRIDAVSALHCNSLGREDAEFLVTVLRGGEPPAYEFNELWEWLTSTPHDSGYARCPTDAELVSLAGESISIEFGRRGDAKQIEYYVTFRVERGAWSGMSFTLSHFEGMVDGDRVLFSASIGSADRPGDQPREERVARLIRSCGLMNFKAGENGADIIARSGTLTDAGEFCIFLGQGRR